MRVLEALNESHHMLLLFIGQPAYFFLDRFFHSRAEVLRGAAERQREGSQTWNVWKAERQDLSALETRKAG